MNNFFIKLGIAICSATFIGSLVLIVKLVPKAIGITVSKSNTGNGFWGSPEMGGFFVLAGIAWLVAFVVTMWILLDSDR